jgi:uncharacterized protein YgiM (DUF1202 family)
MSNVERTTSWQQIQQGIKDAERLIARKEYNLVMIKARQTLECMVRCLTERACLVEGDLSENIDQLYDGRWIDKATRDNYHTIRILGNKAVHEGDDTAYDANQAYQLLTQEVYAFANEFKGRGAQGARPARTSQNRPPVQRQNSARQESNPSRNNRKGQPARRNTARSGYSGAQRSGGARKKKRRRTSNAYYIGRLLVPVLIVVLLIVVIRMLIPDKEKTMETQPSSAVVTTAPTETAPTAPPEPVTEPETQAPAEVYRTTGSTVNVRSEPSTDSSILGQLPKGTEVEYVKRYNNEWTVINYDGREAYISSQYIELVAPEGEAQPEEGAEAPAA